MKKIIEDKVLALGEHTGAKHFVATPSAKVYEEGGVITIESEEEFVVEHSSPKDAHDPLVVPAGKYVRRIVQEFDPFSKEIKKILD